ncbi:hypothetical protein BH23ACT9_BH23ACT9_34680 [soil metagenome]
MTFHDMTRVSLYTPAGLTAIRHEGHVPPPPDCGRLGGVRRPLLPALLLILLLVLTALPAAAQEAPTIQRLAGSERISTAIQIAAEEFADQAAGAVVLARDNDFADALTGAPLAAARRAPLLLTRTDQLPAVTEAEIQRVLPAGEIVYLLGGELAISTAVGQQLEELGYEVVRLGGSNRVETAILIAEEAAPEAGFITIAPGGDFPDALIGGSLASAFQGGVLVLTGGEEDTSARDYVDANPDALVTTIGPAAAARFPEEFNVAGDTPSERSVAAAVAFYDNAIDPSGVALASVEDFPDGLAGAAHAFRAGPLPLLLTPRDVLPQAHVDYITGLDASGPSYVYGGNLAINESVVDQLRSALLD